MNWDYASLEYGLSVALLSCAMFGMGATLTITNFVSVLKAPRGLFVVLAMQALVLPIVAVLMGRFFGLPSGIAIGLILVSALPGGLFSNLITFFGNGNVALSVSATAASTVLSLFTTVFVLKMFAVSELPEGFSMPVEKILGEVLFCMLLPLTLGMVFHRMAAKAAPKVAKNCIRVSVVLLLLIVVAAMTAGRLDLFGYGWKPPLLILLFAMISVWLAYGIAALVRLNVDDSFTVTIEVLVRNTHLGILLKAALFPASDKQHVELADGVLYTLLLYAGICLICSGAEVFNKRKGIGPVFRQKKS